MQIIVVEDRTSAFIEQLVNIWEQSVKATHLFLSSQEIKEIKKYVPQALSGIAHLVVAVNASNAPVAFMGVEEERLEMLFIAPEEIGRGLGRKLIKYGIENFSIKEVTVNERNLLAKGFYEHIGFQVYKRTDYDEQGNPYPLLYMKLEK